MKEEPIKSLELNKMQINFGYSTKLVFPYEQGLRVLEAIEYAESLDDANYEAHKIVPFDTDLSIKILSNQEYKNLKSNALLIKRESNG